MSSKIGPMQVPNLGKVQFLNCSLPAAGKWNCNRRALRVGVDPGTRTGKGFQEEGMGLWGISTGIKLHVRNKTVKEF